MSEPVSKPSDGLPPGLAADASGGGPDKAPSTHIPDQSDLTAPSRDDSDGAASSQGSASDAAHPARPGPNALTCGADTSASDPLGGPPAPDAAPLPRSAFSTLRRRKEFLAAANRGRNCATPGLMLQARLRAADEPGETAVRIGYTCSKKVGNAVARNRAKRRLRAAAAAVLPCAARAGWDYVLVGRAEVTAGRPFDALLVDLRGGLARLHAREDEGRPERPRAPSGKRRGKGGGGGKGGSGKAAGGAKA